MAMNGVLLLKRFNRKERKVSAKDAEWIQCSF